MSDFYAEIPDNNDSAYNGSGNAYSASNNAYESFGAAEENQETPKNQEDIKVQTNPSSSTQSSQATQNQQISQQQVPQKPVVSQKNQSGSQPRPRIRVVPKRKVLVDRAKKQFDWGSYLLGVLSGIIIYWSYRKFRRPKR